MLHRGRRNLGKRARRQEIEETRARNALGRLLIWTDLYPCRPISTRFWHRYARRREDASSDKLRAGARCTSCGGKGATLQRQGWAGNHIGFYPFPTEIADQMRDDDPTRTL